MNIEVFELGPMANCTYLVTQDKDALLIDPAWDINFLEHTLQSKELRLLAVLFTHGHFDHVRDSETMLRRHQLKAYLHPQDYALSSLPEELLQPYSQEKMKIGPFDISVIFTPGHTAGCVCLALQQALFTGDTLFPGACGRVDLPSSNPRQMRQSLLTLSKLAPDTQVFAGHSYGGKCSSFIGFERTHNPFMRNAIKDEKVLNECTP